jgi:SprT-like family
MRRWEQLVSYVALSVILAGATYAYERETLRKSLDARFNRINAEYFDGRLNVRLRWGSLADAYGESTNGEIVVDRWSVTTPTRLDEVLRHESCHQFVGVEHGHDEVWQTCMVRLRGRSKSNDE